MAPSRSERQLEMSAVLINIPACAREPMLSEAGVLQADGEEEKMRVSGSASHSSWSLSGTAPAVQAFSRQHFILSISVSEHLGIASDCSK